MAGPDGGSPGQTGIQGPSTEAFDLSEFRKPDSSAGQELEVRPEAFDLSKFHNPEDLRGGEETSRIRVEETAHHVAMLESAADARDKIATQPGSFDETINHTLSTRDRERAASLAEADQRAVVEAGTDPIRSTTTERSSLRSRLRSLFKR